MNATCVICGAPIEPPRRVYCGEDCVRAKDAERARLRYQTDPAYVRRKNAQTRLWSKTHPEQRNKTRAAYRARLKAAAFARVLEKRGSA